ncbi:hypothetical protein SBI67_10655 [Mycolicibacterium sp. 120266]|uniref:hypothetical protein n=1 Tax=Mycolicibacterium sp. 120266 TaxID=3090601 RepID=UPI00299D56B5|nr:hypothetical protein [Mycolicibacterium sp. 120266]MDX1872582.1 hypothetical protein [Mycolicibacterium sp. 120266]
MPDRAITGLERTYSDNTIAYIDQASYTALRALGRGPVIQFTWIYDRGVDLDGLRRLARNLDRTMLGRRVERSPLPFGRHRWVAGPGPADIEVMAATQPRADVWKWVAARSAVPVDPEWGPVWHLAVQPLAEGGDAVSLVVSHTVSDAGGIIGSIADAVDGRSRDLGYPPPRSRRRGSALRQDLGATIRTLGQVPAAIVGAVRVAREQQPGSAGAAPAVSPAPTDEIADVPMLAVRTDLPEFDRVAAALGGTRNVLFAAVAARLGHRMGRVDAGGRAMLSFPVSERTDGDVTGNALNTITVLADPEAVLGDLGGLRRDLKQALVRMADTRATMAAPLPLTPFVPRLLVRRVEKMVLKMGQPIGCSNIGELPPAVNRPDGTDADYFDARMTEPGVTAAEFAERGGHLWLAVAFLRDRMSLSVASWRAAGPNSAVALADTVRATFADFGLTAAVEY